MGNRQILYEIPLDDYQLRIDSIAFGDNMHVIIKADSSVNLSKHVFTIRDQLYNTTYEVYQNEKLVFRHVFKKKPILKTIFRIKRKRINQTFRVCNSLENYNTSYV